MNSGSAFFLYFFLQGSKTKKKIMKATWAWFPISLLAVLSFTSETLHRIVWLPTASDPMRLKSFFKQQSSFKDLMKGDDDARQDSEAQTKKHLSDKLEISLETSLVTWLHHHRHFSKTVAMMGASWQFAWEKSEKQGVTYLHVHTGLLGHLLRAEIPQNRIGGKLHKFVGTSAGSSCFCLFLPCSLKG